MNATSSVGAWLRAAREAAGLSEDAVAQQLKLAPRQVRAIEEDDYARLPGRTFVRGFVRNYARLVNLDADAVVAALPIGEPTSPLERLTYSPSSRPMGELPVESTRRSGSAARWLIPLVLLAVVAVAAYYEFSRPPAPRPAVPDGIMPPPTPKATTPSSPAGTPLPNPLDAPKSETSSPTVAAAEPAPAAPATAQERAATAASATPPGTSAAAPATSQSAVAAPAYSAPPAAATATATTPTETRAGDALESPLVLTFTGTSWVQVKDASGAVLVSQTVTAGATLPIGGRPPFDVVIGNADHVRTQFRGHPVDLAPHTFHNVARLVLK
jgi:cytoskeleton protein RodZ